MVAMKGACPEGKVLMTLSFPVAIEPALGETLIIIAVPIAIFHLRLKRFKQVF